MARPRAELQLILEGILGSAEVHFQPPSNIEMTYPAIVYSRQYGQTTHADNTPYQRNKHYQATVIDRNPDSPVAEAVEDLPYVSFERGFKANNLNHSIFNIYF